MTAKAVKLATFRSDGPPSGFDADLLLYTQELYEPEDLANLRAKPAIAGGDSIVLLPVMGRRWEFTLTRQVNQCRITNIVFK